MFKSVHENAQDTSCIHTHLYKGDFHASETEKASTKICLAPNKYRDLAHIKTHMYFIENKKIKRLISSFIALF